MGTYSSAPMTEIDDPTKSGRLWEVGWMKCKLMVKGPEKGPWSLEGNKHPFN